MDPLSTTFQALADPTRRAILAQLAHGERSVTELAAPFDMSLPGISKHLKVLEHAGLITRSREAQWRPCRIEPRALMTIDTWLDDYRRLWNARFDRLEEYLRELQAKPAPTKGRKHVRRTKK
ncbi:MAG: winged helix-turn-helix transcriptional regulator [Alphaproteobacteria bacterium]|nr:winged helix-turn-helix transcriptional regulator [Alphaproteobacteria bacterium]MBL7098633.1 winged helix-turn-helix transcriptional regulator [Alphaproteobacteria bacterium]